MLFEINSEHFSFTKNGTQSACSASHFFIREKGSEGGKLNALELQDAILKAVDTLTTSRIDKIQADKTIKCEISKCTNALTGEYRAIYNGGTIIVYANEGSTYTPGDVVFVLVPQADFTNKKVIVSLAGAGSTDDANGQSFVASALSDYNLIGKNVISDNLKVQPAGLHSYRATDYKLLYQHNANGDSDGEKFLKIDQEELNNNIKQAEALMMRASFQTRLPRAHRQTSSGEYGLQFVLAFKDEDNVDENGNAAVKLWSYTLDTYNLSGNPFAYTSAFSDYQIFPIDTENFLYVDSILFYCKNFVTKTDTVNDLAWGADIFVQDVAIYGLKTINATSGDYSMSLSTPSGSTFRSTSSTASLNVAAKVMKLTQNLSDSTMFYWFKEDNRVSASSSDYQAYGGAGWSWLKAKGNNYGFVTYGNENKAYENNYKVVAVYKESVVLKETFTLYNEAAKRDLSITSSLGVKFSFDRGKPTLTCLVDGNESNFDTTKPDDFFKFVWSKVDKYGNTTIFNQTQAQAQETYNKLLDKKSDKNISESERPSYSDIAAARSAITELEGISWKKNKLEYPVNKVDSSATFKCAVYLKDTEDGEEYSIGFATIVLQNETVASPTDYYIMIENGDQVFQYSESGVAPNSERYTDPLEIKNLICHFYDPAGLEVNDKTYTVKWIVPLEDTMIVCPTEMEFNNASESLNIYSAQKTYPLAIEENYDYFALNNQVKCVVSYQGQEYSKYTDFLFTKIGENGTNGTDLTCKIYTELEVDNYTPYIYVLNDSPSIAIDDNGSVITKDISSKLFSFALYQRNENLTPIPAAKWSIAGGNSSSLSKYLSVSASDSTSDSYGVVSWSRENELRAKYRNQIIKASVKYENNDYYAFYPLPIVESTSSDIRVRIDKTSTLKYITYNSDGRNPLYNKNQGISIELLGDLAQNSYVVWKAEGGSPKKISNTNNYELNPINADFALIPEKNSSTGDLIIEQKADATEPLSQVYILPNDTYSGEYTNNVVHAAVYKTYEDYAANFAPLMNIYIPIHMSLNTYGLKSLNAWDGNHIEVNDDENYILAPQIGAGEKDSENKFTGIVMGKAEFYDSTKSNGRVEASSSLGLLGYSAGRQSIFLNAEDGSATFGLPEYDNSDSSYNYTQGRIKLVPNGISSIGNWRIGSRSLYNVVENASVVERGSEDLGSPYSDLKDYNVSGENRYKSSIPPALEGILMSAEPAYLSIKGRLLENGANGQEADANFTSTTTVVQPHDSLELEINPNERSIFTMYRHTTSTDPTQIKFVVHKDANSGLYKIYDERDTSYNVPYAIAVTKSENSNNKTVIIGWYHEGCQSYDGYHPIGRQQYDTSKKDFIDEWYFNLVDEEGKKENPYYLPEMELDAAKKQEYSRRLFKHYHWRREAKVGINNNGRFYTNALKDSSTALNIGDVGAYGSYSNDRKYVGASFEVGSEDNSRTLVKFFTDNETVDSEEGTLYISGSDSVSSEYQRPLVGAFKDISLYAEDSLLSDHTKKDTGVKLYLGRKDEYPYTYLGGVDGAEATNEASLTLYGNHDGSKEENRSKLYSSSGLTIGTSQKDSSPLGISTGVLNVDVVKPDSNAASGKLTLKAEKAEMNFSDKVALKLNNSSDTPFSVESRYGISTRYDNILSSFGKTSVTNDGVTSTVGGFSFGYNTCSEDSAGTISSTPHLSLDFNTINGTSFTTDKCINVITTASNSDSKESTSAIAIKTNPTITNPNKPGEAVGGSIYLGVSSNIKQNGAWTNNLIDYTYLKLIGGSQETSNFILDSPHGSIESKTELNIPGGTTSTGILMGTNVSVPDGQLYAQKIYFDAENLNYNGWRDQKSTKNFRNNLIDQLSYIYSSLQELYNKITAEEQTRSSAITDIWNQIGGTRNQTIWSAIDGKASSGHTHDYVPTKTYNAHSHNIPIRTVGDSVTVSRTGKDRTYLTDAVQGYNAHPISVTTPSPTA